MGQRPRHSRLRRLQKSIQGRPTSTNPTATVHSHENQHPTSPLPSILPFHTSHPPTSRLPHVSPPSFLLLSANVEVVQMDVSDENSVRSAFSRLSSSLSHLDLLINNAAIQSPRQPEDFVSTASASDALNLYRTNVIGPLLIIQQALPLLRSPPPSLNSPPPTVLNISSTFGSISLTSDGNDSTYKMSKAALNQLTRVWAGEVKEVAFIAVSPGWVDTDMGSKGGRKPPLTVEKSVAGIRQIAEGVTLKDSGRFIDYDGKTVPW